MSNDRQPSGETGAADTMRVVDTRDAVEGVGQHVHEAAFEELRDVFSQTPPKVPSQLTPQYCSNLVLIIREWLAEDPSAEVGEEALRKLVQIALLSNDERDKRAARPQDLEAHRISASLREGVRGYFFLATEPDGDDGWPTPEDRPLVLGTSTKITQTAVLQRRRWAALRAARIRGLERDSWDSLRKEGLNDQPKYVERLVSDMASLFDDPDAIDRFLMESFREAEWNPALRHDYADAPHETTSGSSESMSEPSVEPREPAKLEIEDAEVSIPDKIAMSWRARLAQTRARMQKSTVRSPLLERTPIARRMRIFLSAGIPIVAIGVVAVITGALTGFWGLGATGASSGNNAARAPHADTATHQVTPASWGPPRNAVSTQSRNSIVTMNSMIDNPVQGDERNFAQVRSSKAPNSNFADALPITAGEEYTGVIYFHNDAAPDATASVAENTRLRIQIPAVVYGSANVQALLSADNAASTQIWDGFTLVLPEPSQSAALRYVPDSAVIHVGGNVDGQTLDGNTLLGPQGAQLGCDALDGKLPSSDKCSGYVTFRFVVDQPNFTIDAAARLKGSSDPFVNHVNLSPGDVIEVRLAYFNTGTTQQDNVTLRVLGLPKNFRYVAESTKIANSKTKGEYQSTIDGLATTGINLGSYAPGGGNTYVKFDVIVDPDSSSAAGTRWVEASQFARVTTSGGYKEAGLTFTLFSKTQPNADQTTATSSNYWQASWGPQRAVFTLDTGGAPYPAFDSITDNPNIGDERNFVGLRRQTDANLPNVWDDDVWAKVGETFIMRVYVNNAGTDSNGIVSAGWLQGSKLRVGVSHGDKEVSVYGVLSATNATTAWDGATLHLEDGADVVLDTGFALLENNAHPDGGLQLGSAAFSADGVQLGYENMDGVIKPGYQYSSFVTFRLQVVKA